MQGADEGLIDQLGVSSTHLQDHTSMISESGIYALVFESKLGDGYSRRYSQLSEKPSHTMQTNERDLHYSVVKYIRTYHPTLIPGLGEYQTTKWPRADAYTARATVRGGTPDIVIPLLNQKGSGFTIKF